MLPFDRFTGSAQDSASRAMEINQRYGHNQVDTQHILLALLEQPEGVVPQFLDTINVDQALIKNCLDDVLRASPQVARDAPPAGQVFISARVKTILDLANEDALLKDEHISTEHIFLGILSERDTDVARILSEAGITAASWNSRPGLH
jgi:ATP-dependent Clp protease ATP-binding subunit ClpC